MPAAGHMDFNSLLHSQRVLLNSIAAAKGRNLADLGLLWQELADLSQELDKFQGSSRQLRILRREEDKLFELLASKARHG